jgi:hypothetical protein
VFQMHCIPAHMSATTIMVVQSKVIALERPCQSRIDHPDRESPARVLRRRAGHHCEPTNGLLLIDDLTVFHDLT